MEYMFFRKDMFYLVEIDNPKEIPAHVALNPGTIEITDVFGNVFWPTRGTECITHF
jgi:hypothetical protein